MKELEIIYQDDHLVAINKPSGMLVHKTKIADDIKTGFALQLLRDQINQYVYPLHRIDRPTSGVLLFGLSSDIASQMQEGFSHQQVKKEYLAICRGFFPMRHVEEKALRKEKGQEYLDAKTSFWCIDQSTLEIANDRFDTTRVSLIKASPVTGRFHQIRRHLKFMGYPIIGDTTYGDLKINNIINRKHAPTPLCLHAHKVSFLHPVTKEEVSIKANKVSCHFSDLCYLAGFENSLRNYKNT